MAWKTRNNTVDIPHTAAVVAPRPSPIVFLHPNVTGQGTRHLVEGTLDPVVRLFVVAHIMGSGLRSMTAFVGILFVPLTRMNPVASSFETMTVLAYNPSPYVMVRTWPVFVGVTMNEEIMGEVKNG